MDLRYTNEQEAFRDELRAWLKTNVPHDLQPIGSPEGFAAHRAWEQKLFKDGYGALRWPTEYGGRAADVVTQAIFAEEYFLAGGPHRIVEIGHNLMGPTLMVYGTPEQKSRWLPPMLAAEHIWSQGFSEPNAGSDLAGLRTRATFDGDDLIVNGQKIWTSYGAFADWIFALVRTDPDVAKHAGITFLAIDMKAEGVEPRPITELDGHAGFAEVFFTDVRVPRSQVIGEINGGWGVAMTTLGFERDAPAAPAARYRRSLNELVKIARARGLEDDAVVRDTLAALLARTEAYRAYSMRTLTKLARGESLGSEASVTKLLWSELGRDMFETGIDVQGSYGELLGEESPAPNVDDWHSKYWFARAATIYAGTSEIQRNIIAERVLGLPKG
jgi:alkylation response protein AidB-like acyl-CoA dehydrogenase